MRRARAFLVGLPLGFLIGPLTPDILAQKLFLLLAALLPFFNTRPGERRFNPQFGTKLYNYLFEQNIEGFDEILKNVIKDDMNYWFPNVIVNTVFLDITTAQKNKNTDNYIINIKIQFTVNNQTDVLGLTVTSNL